jgi:hypothetical protein
MSKSKMNQMYKSILFELNACDKKIQFGLNDNLTEEQLNVFVKRRDMLEEQLHEYAEQMVI